MTTTADDCADESQIFTAIESFAIIHDSQPVSVYRGGRVKRARSRSFRARDAD